MLKEIAMTQGEYPSHSQTTPEQTHILTMHEV